MSKIKKVLTKLSYPILGSLSNKVQNRLEEKMESYNGAEATFISTLTNLIPYGYAAYNLIKPNIHQYLNEPNVETMDILAKMVLIVGVGIFAETAYRLNKAGGLETTKIVTNFSDLDKAKEELKRHYNTKAEDPFYVPLSYQIIESPESCGSLIGKLISYPFELYLKHKQAKK